MKPIPRGRFMVAVLAGAVIAAETAAHRWMHPRDKRTPDVLHLDVSHPPEGWTPLPEIYRSVRKSLGCSHGLIASLQPDEGQNLHLSYIEWNPDHRGAAIEAFSHLPDQCMGAVGMKLESVGERRRFLLPDGEPLVFDSTVFQPRGSWEKMHVFKGVWLEGLPGADLRSGVLGGNYKSLRTYRIAAAKHRFSPDYSRVVMVTVTGAVDAEEAWELAREHILLRLSLRKPLP